MLDIQPLSEADLESALGLSTQAEWNQLPADWKRFFSLWPEGCFGGYVDDELVGTTCVATYGTDVSWIGMVLVDENHRKNGYGSKLFEHGLEYARAEGGTRIGLDATVNGAPIYRDYGFESTEEISRWQGTIEPVDCPLEASMVCPSRNSALYELDRSVVDVDRTELLADLIEQIGATPLYVTDEDEITGYAILRPGRVHPQVGPIIAPRVDEFTALLNRINEILADPTVIVDCVPTEETAARLEAHGLERTRELRRMTHGSPEPLLESAEIRGIVDFAFG